MRWSARPTSSLDAPGEVTTTPRFAGTLALYRSLVASVAATVAGISHTGDGVMTRSFNHV